MGFTLTFYKNKSGAEVVNKNIEVYETIECEQWLNDVLEPTFIIPYKAGYTRSINYVFCDTFNRYYFIDNISIDRGRLYIKCTHDVLMNYKNYFLNTNQIVLRNEHLRDKMLADSNIPISAKIDKKVIEFTGQPFNIQSGAVNSRNFLICVAGGSVGATPNTIISNIIGGKD